MRSLLIVALLAGTAHAEEAPEGMVSMSAGCFKFGCRAGERCNDFLAEHEVCLDAYAIDTTEVTIDAYQKCVDAGACKLPKVKSNLCNTDGNTPRNCVSWTQATTYCAWAGKRLPTEAEWEYAAGGKAGTKYPWGDDALTCDRAATSACKTKGMLPVGSKPAGDSPEGVKDLSGNAFEYVSDWYDEKAKKSKKAVQNPKGPCDGKAKCKGKKYKVLKGGSADSAEVLLQRWARYFLTPDHEMYFMGFRCVK